MYEIYYHHHDFSIFDTDANDYNIVDATPYGQVVIAKLAKACHTEGIKLFFYYSLLDWHHSVAKMGRKYKEKWKELSAYPAYKTDTLFIPNFPKSLKSAKFYDSGKSVKFKQVEELVFLYLKDEDLQPIDTTTKLAYYLKFRLCILSRNVMSKFTLPEITEEDKAQLVTYARSQKVEYRIRLRAQIILDWMDGLTYSASCNNNDVSEVTINKWRRRFSEAGLAGLQDAPRSGKPREVDAEIRNRVIHLACQRTDSGTQKYSQHEIAEHTNISQSHVSNILQATDLKPHKTEYWRAQEPRPGL